MYNQARQVIYYRTAAGQEPYVEFLESLRDRRAAALLQARIRRVGLGTLGDARPVGEGVLELRVHQGPGYRIYVGLKGNRIVVLTAGDKSTQGRDILKAQAYWEDFRRNP